MDNIISRLNRIEVGNKIIARRESRRKRRRMNEMEENHIHRHKYTRTSSNKYEYELAFGIVFVSDLCIGPFE